MLLTSPAAIAPVHSQRSRRRARAGRKKAGCEKSPAPGGIETCATWARVSRCARLGDGGRALGARVTTTYRPLQRVRSARCRIGAPVIWIASWLHHHVPPAAVDNRQSLRGAGDADALVSVEGDSRQRRGDLDRFSIAARGCRAQHIAFEYRIEAEAIIASSRRYANSWLAPGEVSSFAALGVRGLQRRSGPPTRKGVEMAPSACMSCSDFRQLVGATCPRAARPHGGDPPSTLPPIRPTFARLPHRDKACPPPRSQQLHRPFAGDACHERSSPRDTSTWHRPWQQCHRARPRGLLTP